MSAGLIFASNVGNAVAFGSLSDDVLDIMENKMDQVHDLKDPILAVTQPAATNNLTA